MVVKVLVKKPPRYEKLFQNDTEQFEFYLTAEGYIFGNTYNLKKAVAPSGKHLNKMQPTRRK